MEGDTLTYFCSDIRIEDLPIILKNNNIAVNEVEVYSTKLEAPRLPENIKGVMFYSPSTIDSFLKMNSPNCIAYCIGETTAKKLKNISKKFT